MIIKNFNSKKKILIIAEIGNNHEGSYSAAKKLIYEASKTGVDAVKFQTFKTENFLSDNDKVKFSKYKKFELSKSEFIKLAKYSKEKKLIFISTPLDLESAAFLNKIVDCFKISSGDNNFFQLIEKVLNYNKPIIISCGLLNFSEIKKLIIFIKKKNFSLKKLSLLHCVSSYPVLLKEANLKAIKFLKKKFNVNIGYSDHTIGKEAAIVAAAYGANIIEKHFTLNNNYSSFRDHKLSLNPRDMKQMVTSVRKVSLMLGKEDKLISKSEKKNIFLMRRAIYSKENLNDTKKIINKKLKKKLKKNNLIKKEYFK